MNIVTLRTANNGSLRKTTVKDWPTLAKALAYARRYAHGPAYIGVEIVVDGHVVYRHSFDKPEVFYDTAGNEVEESQMGRQGSKYEKGLCWIKLTIWGKEPLPRGMEAVGGSTKAGKSFGLLLKSRKGYFLADTEHRIRPIQKGHGKAIKQSNMAGNWRV